MKKVLLSLLVLEVFFLCSAKQQRLFRHGRSTGGNLGAPGDHGDDNLPDAQWFEQKLDHSTFAEARTWKQRYFVNSSFFDIDNPGPVFLMIGGEGPADARWMVKGAWIENAVNYKALCIFLEHRFYGESFPTEDLSVKNLQYLSSYQALADLANFIVAMNKKYELKHDVKWIAFGGSYPGSLAAWLRLKYPHLVYAALSSSGPLLAKADFKEYFQVVLRALREKTRGEECVNQVKSAHKQIVELMKTNPKEIETEFKVCAPFSNATSKDIQNFYNSVADDFAGVVQYNEDNRFSVKPKYKNITINSVCDMLTAPGSEESYKRLAKFNAMMLEQSNSYCLDYSYDAEIRSLINVKLNPEGTRQWMYQTCTEFGFYQTSSGTSEYFGDFDLDFFIEQCQDVFGKKFDASFINKAVKWTNVDYGALDIDDPQILFVHGSVDPWHALGYTDTASHKAIYIQGTAHCANMYPSSETDSYNLVQARRDIQYKLTKWLAS